jgi:hypothetical protein
MSQFQPRIEEPPEGGPDRRKEKQSENEQLREFVRAAAGKWCLVYESALTTKPERTRLRSRLWAVFMCLQGFQHSGFQVRFHYIDKVFKVYARFDAARVMKSPQ